jgi:DNA-3-methyladenine glycosylase
LAGPGKVGQALDLSTDLSGHALYLPGGLELLAGTPASRVVQGPRVGIEYARRKDIRAPLRFADADSEWVTHRKGLK